MQLGLRHEQQFQKTQLEKIAFYARHDTFTVCFGHKQPRVFLFVHGAWDYAKVDSILTSKGDIVYRPTLTGLGETIHLLNANVNLTTYITDIINGIKFENLHNIILVGYGVVISGVAEQIPDRIHQLVYPCVNSPKT
jgi:hypothetical protein